MKYRTPSGPSTFAVTETTTYGTPPRHAVGTDSVNGAPGASELVVGRVVVSVVVDGNDVVVVIVVVVD